MHKDSFMCATHWKIYGKGIVHLKNCVVCLSLMRSYCRNLNVCVVHRKEYLYEPEPVVKIFDQYLLTS